MSEWPLNPGKKTLTGVTVATVQEKTSSKGNTYYVVSLDGYPGTVYCPDKLTPGETLDLECETTSGERGIEQKLRKPRAFGGGGGGFKPQKTPGDIAVMQGCTLATASASLVGTLVTMGAVKSSEDALNALEAVHKRLTALSKSAIQELKAVVS